jgi:hypothetical protein
MAPASAAGLVAEAHLTFVDQGYFLGKNLY